MNEPHISILVEEFLEQFSDRSLEVFVDGTLGAGGHAKAILDAHPEIKIFVGFDRDESAMEIAKERLKDFESKTIFISDNFANLDQRLKEKNIKSVDGFFLTWGCHLCN